MVPFATARRIFLAMLRSMPFNVVRLEAGKYPMARDVLISALGRG